MFPPWRSRSPPFAGTLDGAALYGTKAQKQWPSATGSADSLTQRMRLRVLGAVPADSAKISAMSKLDRKQRGRTGHSTATDTAAARHAK